MWFTVAFSPVGCLQYFPLRTVVSIVSLLLTLEARHLTQILLHEVAITVAVMSTVSSRVVRVSSLVAVVDAPMVVMAMSIAAVMAPMVTSSMLGVSII